jgi:hypothetical protein
VQATSCSIGTNTLATGSTSANHCIPIGRVAVVDIERAIQDGSLVPFDPGKAGRKELETWVGDVKRSVDFLEGPQKQAGCVGVRNAIAKADGDPSPKDRVKGPAREKTETDLRRVSDENSCGG